VDRGRRNGEREGCGKGGAVESHGRSPVRAKGSAGMNAGLRRKG
jgi:hypothetical protein